MNKKELAEIRKRFRIDRNNIQHIYGCYVNGNKEIVSRIEESLGTLPKEEQEEYISLLKKSLSGSLGKNLQTMNFSTQQVMEGEEHKLLSALRRTELKDPFLRDEFYKAVAANLNIEDSNYLILLAFDRYDVPHFDKNGEKSGESDDVFSYIVCSVSPVRPGKAGLSYSGEESRFHHSAVSQVAAPEVGFMFPAFDDRTANIYNALLYSRKTDGMHEDFINAVFKTEVPLAPKEQKDAFSSVLAETLEKDCSFDVIRNVHQGLREKIEVHKESKDPEPLTLLPEEIADILEQSGVDPEERASFVKKCEEQFGENKELSPENLMESKKFEIATDTVKIKIDPNYSSLVKTEVIEGRKYLLIPADAGVEVNGIAVSA